MAEKKRNNSIGIGSKRKARAKKSIKDSIVARVDRVKNHTSKSINSLKKKNKHSAIPILAIGMFALLFIISLGMLLRQSNRSTDAVIVQDVEQLKQIIMKVDTDCKIIDLEHTKNYVDFLTVKEFVGSEVGAVNLKYPYNWKGPYLQDNPTVQQQQYIILKNNNGYYLVPGDGVTLGNGKKVGEDIVLDANSDIEKLLQDPHGLKSEQGALGAPLNIGKSFVQKALEHF